MYIREAEGQSGKKTLGHERQNEELKNISWETSPPVVPYSLFLVLLVVPSGSDVALKHKHPRIVSGGSQAISY